MTLKVGDLTDSLTPYYNYLPKLNLADSISSSS